MRRVALFTLFVGLAASCTGGTCGGCGDGNYTFPRDDPQRPDAIVQDDVARVRITQDFLDFIRPQLPDLILAQAGSLGGGITIEPNGTIRVPLPDQALFDIGVAEANMREAEATIFLDDLEERLRLELTEPSGARLVLDNLRVGLSLKLKEDFLGIDSSCPVVGDLGSDPKHAAEVTVEATIDPGVGPRPDYALDVDVQVSEIALDDLDVDVLGQSAYCQEPECRDCGIVVFGTCLDIGGRCGECVVFCGGITDGLAALVGALSDVLSPLLTSILSPIVDNLINDTLNQINGTSALVEAAIDIADISGLDILARSEAFGLFAAPRPGRLVVNDRGAGLGMELTLDSGLEAPIADCVGQIAPFQPSAGPAPILSGIDRDGNAYHLGFTVSAAFLNQALYTAHRAGTLCLKLSTDDVRDLTGGTFSLNASLLSLLASDLNKIAEPAAPAIVELKPRNPATLELGTGGRIGEDPQGNDIFDWLLKARWTDIGVAFHVLIQDRYVRVFEVTTDVFVGMNLTVRPDNSLQVALGEIRIDDFREEFNELLPNADFSEVLPTILDVALGAVLNQALVFDLDLSNAISDALGGAPLFLRVNEIFRDGVQDDYLTMTVTFSSTTAPAAFNQGVETQAYLHPSEPGLIERQPGDGWAARATGLVRLVVGEDLPYTEAQGLEYQLRVDQGLWSIWRPARPDNTLVATDARLKMPGWHDVDIRARAVDDYTTLDRTPVGLSVLVDPIAPRLSARHGQEGIEVRAEDAESHGASLTVEMRIDDAWRAIDLEFSDNGVAKGLIPYAGLPSHATVQLRARDGSGNPSDIVSLAVRLPEDAPARRDAIDSEGGFCRCVQSSGSSVPARSAPWLGIAFCVGLLWRRRRTPDRP